jgi:hypothetical protein
MLKPIPSPKQSIFVPITLSLLCVAGLGLGFLVPGAGVHLSRLKQPLQQSTSSANPPIIFIQSQPNAPLSILAVKSDSATVHNPEFDLTVMNTSDKPIRAYAIRYDTVSTQSSAGGLELTNKQGHGAVLRPGRSETIDIGGGVYQADEIIRIMVSVDFVEFDDGLSWGLDTYKSAERLDGLRAGAHAAAQHLLKVLKAGGPATVFTALETDSMNLLPPSGHTDKWLEGFQEGISFIKERLKHNSPNRSASEIDFSLRQPVDASER